MANNSSSQEEKSVHHQSIYIVICHLKSAMKYLKNPNCDGQAVSRDESHNYKVILVSNEITLYS